MIAEAPPPIPASRESTRWDPRLHLLVWAHTGRTHVRLHGGGQHQIDEGTGIWLPAGSDHELWTDPGSLAIPAWVHPRVSPGAPAAVTRFAVAKGWRDWLIHHYVLGLGPMSSSGYAPDSLLDVLHRSAGSAPPEPVGQDTSLYPRMPVSTPARAVAEQLVRSPALDHTVEQWSTVVASSPRTLRRTFLDETGMTFSQWRTQCRLVVAREFLAAGFGVEHAAALSGFGSRNGLTRAFGDHFGLTPRDFLRQQGSMGRPVSARVARTRQVDTVLRLMANDPVAEPELPATFTAPRVNDFHVLAWTYRGDVWARVGSTRYSRRRGDAIWLPAGVENETGWPAGSLGVPVGDLRPDQLRLAEPLRVRFPSSWDTYLLHCSVSAYTGLRPDSYDPKHILDLFEAQVAAERARSVPMPEHPRAKAAAMQFLGRLGSTSEIALDRAARDAFRVETGMSFNRWRRVARMRVARDLLDTGVSPTVVARRLGYSRLSNFSRDFRAEHQVAPREYVQTRR